VIEPSTVPLKSGHDDDLAVVEQLVNLLGRDVGDAGLGVNAVRGNSGLSPREGTSGAPKELIAIAVKAMLVCSPVARRTSISRSVVFAPAVTSAANSINRFVTPPMAETTATTLCPAAWVANNLEATLRMRSGEPTEVPPYFWTINDTTVLHHSLSSMNARISSASGSKS